MIWHKPIKLESLKLKLEQVKTWSKCTFFKMNLFNPSVWTPLSAHQGQILCHKTYASSMAIFLQTVSKMPAYLIFIAHVKKYGDKQIKIRSPMTKLKTLLSLANKINQSINQFRMNIIKP